MKEVGENRFAAMMTRGNGSGKNENKRFLERSLVIPG
jgi:hypothetical protein